MKERKHLVDPKTGQEYVAEYAGPSIHDWSSCHGHWTLETAEKQADLDRMREEMRIDALLRQPRKDKDAQG